VHHFVSSSLSCQLCVSFSENCVKITVRMVTGTVDGKVKYHRELSVEGACGPYKRERTLT